VIQCFIEDSGSDPKPGGIFVLAGYVMDEARWDDFVPRWEAELQRSPGIEFCRMADAESGEGKFRGIESPFRKMKVKSLARVVQECYPSALVAQMNWDDYAGVVKGNVDPRLENPYAFLFFKILAMNAQLQRAANEHADFGFKPVDFIFDQQGPAGLKCLEWYGHLKQRAAEPDRSILAQMPQFKDDRVTAPLQAADMFAWHIRREFAYPKEDRRAVFEMLNPAGALVYTYASNELRGIVEAWNTRLDPSTI
jgi:hypothetical protein